jgi:hypothetical protein
MNKVTKNDIQRTSDGWYILPCAGNCNEGVSVHRFLYYTKNEVWKLWKEKHQQGKQKT